MNNKQISCAVCGGVKSCQCHPEREEVKSILTQILIRDVIAFLFLVVVIVIAYMLGQR